MITETSRQAYRDIDHDQQRKKVLRQIRADKSSGSCIVDIAEITGIDKSSVSGRMRELKDLGQIQFVGKRPSKTTRINSEHWRALEFMETFDWKGGK